MILYRIQPIPYNQQHKDPSPLPNAFLLQCFQQLKVSTLKQKFPWKQVLPSEKQDWIIRYGIQTQNQQLWMDLQENDLVPIKDKKVSLLLQKR